VVSLLHLQQTYFSQSIPQVLEETRGEAELVICHESATGSVLGIEPAPSSVVQQDTGHQRGLDLHSTLPETSDSASRTSDESVMPIQLSPTHNNTMGTINWRCARFCSCKCHGREISLPARRNANRGVPFFNLRFHFVHRCSTRRCRTNKTNTQPEGTLTISKWMVKGAIAISLISQSLNNRVHLKAYKLVPESAESIRFATSGNLEGLKRLIQTGLATINDTTLDNWTLTHVSYHGFLSNRLIAIELCVPRPF
jgi:hypothetical protein